MKINIINSQSRKYSHEIFNSGFCDVISILYPKSKIIYYGEEENISLIKKIRIDKKEIEFKCINVYGRNNSGRRVFINFIENLYYYLHSFFIDIKIYFYLDKKDIIFYTQSNPFSLIFLNIINLFLKKQIFIVMHGELEMFLNAKFYKIISLIYKITFKLFLISKQIKIIVLGDCIKHNLLRNNLIKKDKIISLEHPFYLSIKEENKINEKTNIKEKVIISLIGENFIEEFVELASNIKNKNIKFKNISGIKTNNNKKIEYPFFNLNRNPKREEINKEIQNSDFIIYLYPKTRYKYMASGAIFDAISNKVPIICLENDYFNYIFDIGGDLGYKIDNLKEMKIFLENFKKNKEEYIEFENNIEKYIKKRTIYEITEKFRKELKNV